MDPLDFSMLTSDFYSSELRNEESEEGTDPQPTGSATPVRRGRAAGNRRSIGLLLSPKPVLNKPGVADGPPTPSKLSVSASSFKRRSQNFANLLRHPTSIRNRSSSAAGCTSPGLPPDHRRQTYSPISSTFFPTNLTPTPPPGSDPKTSPTTSPAYARNSLLPSSHLCLTPEETYNLNCRCCNRPITLDPLRLSQPVRCSSCAIIWDSPDSFLVSQTQTEAEPDNGCPPSTILKITEEEVALLDSLSLSQEQLDSFDRDPAGFLSSIVPGSELDRRIKDFDQLASDLLTKLFSSLENLSTAFLTIIQNKQTLQIDLVNSFYRAICNGPTGRDNLCSKLHHFLHRPGKQSVSILSNTRNDSNQSPIQWAWAVVLLQCPILSPSSKTPFQKRLIITARILGLISSMPNRLHHKLVEYYSDPICSTQLFEEKVEIVNVFISDRICYFLQIPDGFGASSSDSSHHYLPKYMCDWSLLASCRVMALLCGSNNRSRKLPITSFYNVSTDLIQPIDLIYDFEAWESRKSSYTLCGYPCLLSMSSKISLLTYDGKRQMGMEARQAFIDSLLGRSLAPPVLPLSIRRSHLVEDSLRQISHSRSELKKLLKISFVDEEGVDGGGLKKEWFLLLIRELVAPEYGMFLHDSELNQIWFNPASTELEEFRLIGIVIGLAIYNRATLDFGLPLVGYRKLLGLPVTELTDLASLKPEVANSLKWILEYDGDDLEEICSRNFVGDYDAYGTVREVPLLPNGENLPVTKSNRTEFVKLYCDYVLNKSITQQFQAFSDGFHSIAAGNGLSLFQPEEIELLVIGSSYDSKLSVEDLKAITTYDGFLSTDSTIQYFWSVVNSFDFEDQKKLLRFITGTDRIPATGISGLTLKISKSTQNSPPSNNNNRSRNLNSRRSRIGYSNLTNVDPSSSSTIMANNERLPESHTCFNQLILSEFNSVHSLHEKLSLAINESLGFGLN
ncbi:hypothetical protein PSTG_14836 [Puccinia striiformis f. sp. tritici PST-78]|uniref:HECT-type E3 ubiquitin transferase n=1 Tax=Puccinia striiformis f. sp. tritici PST-78 TaxID=1165861 RepID=A0A0L0UXJ4_9BASI|nr:hypothetical protein PSTG_14836 [Puccinia striiformis f. sp. tritici PST-78]